MKHERDGWRLYFNLSVVRKKLVMMTKMRQFVRTALNYIDRMVFGALETLGEFPALFIHDLVIGT